MKKGPQKESVSLIGAWEMVPPRLMLLVMEVSVQTTLTSYPFPIRKLSALTFSRLL